ncbi:MAG: hypothetical protein AB7V21_07935 [Phycisphaerales bacterium]
MCVVAFYFDFFGLVLLAPGFLAAFLAADSIFFSLVIRAWSRTCEGSSLLPECGVSADVRDFPPEALAPDIPLTCAPPPLPPRLLLIDDIAVSSFATNALPQERQGP